MRHYFLEKLYTKCGGETSPWAFFTKSKLNIYLDQQSSFIQFVFTVCPSRGLSKKIKLSCRSHGFTSYQAFLKTKWGLELVSVSHFACYIALTDRISSSDCLYFLRCWAIFVL